MTELPPDSFDGQKDETQAVAWRVKSADFAGSVSLDTVDAGRFIDAYCDINNIGEETRTQMHGFLGGRSVSVTQFLADISKVAKRRNMEQILAGMQIAARFLLEELKKKRPEDAGE